MRRRVLSSSARTSGLRILSVSLAARFSWPFFSLGEIAEQPAYADILGLFGGLDVKLLGLQLHGLDFLADGVERQVFGQPDRAAFQEALDVLAADRRQMRAKALS
jgi:hypothetical protein